ncbi:hypothetical protein [Clostridium estertheticum]|uniref:Phage head-tail adapter protein n=1 Tax=Clostridium estertheticum subsp. estertheticum TaxID=1552 RepID=A0A1J0GIA8_9CLOT|nr:hypothetical protein [Clostridium estertheticum]APC41061.1 hypothetical protein A7L45_13745 [Clostridium estertheticum subsp. estertheticum]
MAGINRTKISEKLYKQLDKKGLLKEIKILRIGKNAYKEKLNDLYVCTVKGFYYRKETRINISATESATLNSNYSERVLIIYDEESKKIKQDDYFTLAETKYKIIDTGNAENIIYDMQLDRS